MEKIKGFTIELSLDSLKVDSGLRDLKSSMRLMNSEMRSNMSAFSRSERSMEKYGVQLDGLNKKYKLQEEVVEDARKKHEDLTNSTTATTAQIEKAATEYNNARAQLNNLGRYIDNVTDEMNEFKRAQEIQSSGWYKTGDALESFGTKLGGVSEKAREVGGTLTRRITLPVMGITTAVGGMVAAFGWGRLVSVDNAQAQLKGLGYETKDVERISGQLSDALEGGMLTMGEATSAAATAMAAGVEEGEELTRYIQILDGTVAGSSGTFEEMEQIFGRIVDQGHMTRNEFDMIAQRMPGFSKAVQEGMNVSSNEMYEMLRNGEITTDQFLDIMEDFSGEMAKENAKTWDGMKQNTKAFIGILGESLLGGVFEQSKESLAEFIDLLNSNQAKEWAKETGETLGNAFSSLVDKIKGVIHWYKDLSDGQKEFILGIGGFIVALGPLLTGLGVLGGFIAKISSGLGVFFKFLAPILTPLKGVGTAAAGAGKSVGLLSGALKFMTGPVGIAIGVITALTTGFTIAYKKSETFRNFIDKLGEKIKEVFFGIVDWIRPGFDAVIGFFNDMKEKVFGFVNEEGPHFIEAWQNIWEFISPILEWMADKVKWAFDTVIKPVMTLAMEAVKLVIEMVWGNIKGIITGTLDVIMGAIKIFSGALTGDWDKMWEGVKQLTTGAIKVVWNWIQLQFIGRILKGVAGLAIGFWDHIKNMWAWVKETFKNSITSVYGSVKNSFVGRIIQAIINFVKNFKLNISNMWTRVKEIFKSSIANVYGRIKESFVGRIIQSIINFVKNFRQHITNMWTRVKDTFKNSITNVYNNIKKSFVGQIIKSIVNFVKNFKLNITNMWKSVKDTFSKWIKNIRNSIANSFVGHMLKSVGKLKTNFVKIAKEMWQGVKKQFGNIVDGAKGLPGRIGKGISGAKKKAVDAMKDVGNNLIVWAGTPFNKVVGGVNWITGKMGIKKKIGYWKYPQYAEGTKGAHSGGLAMVNDGRGRLSGRELIKFPDGSAGMFRGKDVVANLPKGTHVFSAPDTRELLGGIPQYNRGTESTKNFLGKGSSMTGGKARKRTWAEKVWDYVKKPKKLLDIALDKVGAKLPKNTAMFKNMIKGGFTKTKDAAIDKVKSVFKENEYDDPNISANIGGSGVKRWTGVATRALRMTGSYSASNLKRLLFQMKTESNGNPRAINDWDINAKRGTPSKGLMQVIDPTFAAYKMPGYNNIWNPLDNILASIRYALARYGSLSKAYRGVGYKQGTNYVPENQWAFLHKGEAVIPEKYNRQPKKTDAMKLLALVAKKIGYDDDVKISRASTNKNDGIKDLLNATLEQNEILMKLLNKNQDIYMQERLVGGILAPVIDEQLERDRIRRDKFRG